MLGPLPLKRPDSEKTASDVPATSEAERRRVFRFSSVESVINGEYRTSNLKMPGKLCEYRCLPLSRLLPDGRCQFPALSRHTPNKKKFWPAASMAIIISLACSGRAEPQRKRTRGSPAKTGFLDETSSVRKGLKRVRWLAGQLGRDGIIIIFFLKKKPQEGLI